MSCARYGIQRWRVLATGVAASGVVVALLMSPPNGAEASAGAASPVGEAVEPDRAVEVTLITGDRVRYEAGLGDAAQVTVVEAVSASFRGEEPPEGGLYLYPDVAEPYVVSGVLDRELFNIEYLATHGYDDAEMERLPLIVDYAESGAKVAARASSDAEGLAASRTEHVLESIGAAGVSVDKENADRFWESLAPSAASDVRSSRAAGEPGLLSADGRGSAVEKVWLDRKVTVTLDESVSLIGAPQTWEAGFDGTGVTVAVLDTGIDATHPDLEGKVVAAESFVSDTAVDGNGHGTHVASSVVGSGAASDGTYKGVAPGADLVVGKVLDDEGSGTTAQIIAGMEWAAQEQDADVISMSLGCGPKNGCPANDGTDVMSQAVNNLTASTDALFVIAAGNDGATAGTIGTPGVADAALTVAATDERVNAAPIVGFSSRGPRVDGILKPDIAAPGVNIIAARAAGTDMCGPRCSIPGDGPINEHYYSVSGTSMATPQVAGAAAILAQQHPDWTAKQLKTTLMSTARELHDFGLHVGAYAQGAGRVDIARAVSQQLRTETENITPGILETGEAPYVTSVVYHNDSTSDLTVTVDAELWRDFLPAAEGMISLDQNTLMIPAGASATVTVTIDADVASELGAFDGAVTAITEAGDSVRTPVGVTIYPPRSELTIQLVKPAPVSELPYFFHGQWIAHRVDDLELPWNEHYVRWRTTDDPDVIEGTMAVPDGIYSITSDPNWARIPGRQVRHFAWIVKPEVTVDGDTTITVDMRELVPVSVTADQPTEQVWRVNGHNRTTEAGVTYSSWGLFGMPEASQQWWYPSEPVTLGDLSVREGFMLAQPDLLLDLRSGGQRLSLQPAYPDYPADAEDQYPKFTRDIDTVLATEADLEAGRDVRGALVLFNLPNDLVGSWEPCPTPPEISALCAVINRAQAAAEAGAAGVLLTTPKIGLQHLGFLNEETYLSQMPVPVAWLDAPQADELADLMKTDQQIKVRIDATVETEYEYKVWLRETGQVPADMTYELDRKDLKRVDVGYHSAESAAPGMNNAGESMHAFWPGETLSFGIVRYFDAPTRREEYYLPTGPGVVHHFGYYGIDYTSGVAKYGNEVRTLVNTGSETLDWGTVATPGQARVDDLNRDDAVFSFCAVCRQGDHLWVQPAPTMGDGRHNWLDGYSQSMRLFDADGAEISARGPGQFELSPESGRYRLEHVQTDLIGDDPHNREVRTVWDFTATAKPTENEVELPYGKPQVDDPEPAAWQPVIFLNYDIPLALDNTARAGRPLFMTVHAAAGKPGSGADIAGLELEASFDDGETWADARVVRPTGDGEFQVMIKHPRLAATTGAVTLRARAWDKAGNEVVQTIERAYGLRD